MNKGKSTWKHNKLLTARRNYFKDGGAKLDWSNPFKGDNGGAALTGLMGAAGSAIGQIGGAAIGGGLQSGAGNVISGLSGIASAIPGPWGAVASAGLGVVGGLVNRTFGSKINDANVKEVEGNINKLNSFTSNANSFDQLANNEANATVGMAFDDSFIGKDGWFSSKAKRKAEALREKVKLGKQWVASSLENNANNLRTSQMQDLMANFAAYGGPLGFGGGALDYDLAQKALAIKTAQATGQSNSLTALPNSFTGFDTFAFGGELNTQGADFTNGMIYVGNGGSHETNPYEGVQMGLDPEGTPNLVEEGETIFNDYVFSKRIAVPKAIREKYKLRGTKEMTFAEASKKLAKESEERPNDPISQRGLEALMGDLAMAQETIKQGQRQKNFAAFGGGINRFDEGGPFNSYGYVKGYNGGWYGADGKYTADYLARVNGLTREQLQAQFDDQYNFYNTEANRDTDRWKAIDAFYKSNPRYNQAGYKVTDADVARAKKLGQDNKPGYMHYLVNEATKPAETKAAAANRYWLRNPNGEATPITDYFEGRNANGYTWAELNPTYKSVGAGVVRDPVDVDGTPTTYTDFYFDNPTAPAVEEPKPEEKPDLTPSEYGHKWEGWRYAPVVGLGLGVLTDALGLTNKPEYGEADAVIKAGQDAMTAPQVRWNPIGNYLAYTPFDRNYYLNQLRSSTGATRRNILNTSGGNRGQAMAGLLAADYNAGIQMGALARQAEEYNLAQRKEVETFNRATDQANSEGFLKADIANQETSLKARGYGLEAQMKGYAMRQAERQAADAAKADNITGFINSIGNIGRDNAALNGRNFALASGVYGPIQPEYEYILTGRKPKKRACSGKMRRRRKGLTD